MRLLLIGHDAFPAGAQKLLLETGRTFRRSFGVDIRFILLEGGAMMEDYRAIAPVEILPPTTGHAMARLNTLRAEGFEYAILNSAASSTIAPLLHDNAITYTFLIHELPHLLQSRDLRKSMGGACETAQSVVVPTRSCAARLGLEKHPRMTILPQGLYDQTTFSRPAREALRSQLGLTGQDLLVIGVGYADMRKGFDLFLQLWRKLAGRAHCVWVGAIDPVLQDGLRTEIDHARTRGTFHMPGRVRNVSDWLSASDVFTLTSREDPYPSVVLEALASGLPCTSFADNGGIPELLKSLQDDPTTCNTIVPFADVRAMSLAALELAQWSKGRTQTSRQDAARKLGKSFLFRPYAEQLLRLTAPKVPSVSVVVPSYNYARYLEARLVSIFTQTFPVLEIIVLDDASTDKSVEVAVGTAAEWGRDVRIIKGRRPSGSVFAQWQKALKQAQGEWVWIAEADDLCDPHFLEKLVHAAHQCPNTVMAFCDSRSIDENGAPLSASYQPYCMEASGNLLEHDGQFSGRDFLQTCLSERNLVLNVSGAIFQKTAMQAALKKCKKDLAALKVAGDWRVYLELLDNKDVSVVYVSDAMNIHRRHQSSSTHTLNQNTHLEEIKFMHELVSRRLHFSDGQAERQKLYHQKIRQQFRL